MKKMKKSVKIGLFSALSVVCVIAIALGCFFAFKPKTQPERVLSWSERIDLLGQEISTANLSTNKVETLDYDVNYSSYLYSEDEVLTNVGKNYFATKNKLTNEKFVYLCKVDAGTTKVVSVTNSKDEGGFAETDAGSCTVLNFNEKFVVVQNIYSLDDETEVTTISAISIETQKEVVKLGYDEIQDYKANGVKFSENKNSAVLLLTKEISEETDRNEFYFLDLVNAKSYKLNTFDLVYTATQSVESDEDKENYVPNETYYLTYFGNSAVFSFNNEVHVYFVANNKLYTNSFTLGENQTIASSMQLASNQVVVKVKTSGENGADSYSYKLFTFAKNSFKSSDLEVKEGVVNIDFEAVSDSFYLTREYKENEEKFTTSYYYKDNGLVCEFESSVSSDKVLNAKSGKVLTTSAFMKFEDAQTFEKFVEFGECATLFSKGNAQEKFYVATYNKDNETYSFNYYDLNLDDILSDLEFVYGEGEDQEEFIPTGAYSDGVGYILQSDNKYFRLDTETNKFNLIENYFIDDRFEFFLFNDLNIYLEKNEDETFKLSYLSGETIFDNISTYNFEDGIKETVEWYLNNQDWINNILSGEYQNAYKVRRKNKWKR